MNINIGYFQIFHIRGQINMCYITLFSNKLYFDICIFKKLNQTLRVHTENASISLFKTFSLEVNKYDICIHI